MTNDRNYLRMMQDVELTRHAQDNVRTELEFVLLERLERLIGVDDELDKAKNEIDDLNIRLTSCVDQALWSLDEIEAMQEMLDAK